MTIGSSFTSGNLRLPHLARAPYSRRLLELISRCTREDPHARPTPEQLYRITGSCLAACRDYQAKLGEENLFRIFYRGVDINDMETGFWQPEYLNQGFPNFEDLQFPVEVDGVGITPPPLEEFYPYKSYNRDFFTQGDNTYKNRDTVEVPGKPIEDKIALVPHAYNYHLWPILYGENAFFSKRLFNRNIRKYGHGEKEGNNDDGKDSIHDSDGSSSIDDSKGNNEINNSDESDSGNENDGDDEDEDEDEDSAQDGENGNDSAMDTDDGSDPQSSGDETDKPEEPGEEVTTAGTKKTKVTFDGGNTTTTTEFTETTNVKKGGKMGKNGGKKGEEKEGNGNGGKGNGGKGNADKNGKGGLLAKMLNMSVF